MSKTPRPKGFEDPNFMPSQLILKALGRVSVVSASIEEELHALYWKLLGTTDNVGKVINRRHARKSHDRRYFEDR